MKIIVDVADGQQTRLVKHERELAEGSVLAQLSRPMIVIERYHGPADELIVALKNLADRVEEIELPDGSTPDTLEARMVLAKLEGVIEGDLPDLACEHGYAQGCNACDPDRS